MQIILAIESSCDETSASVIIDGKIRSNIVTSQEVHKTYGGVVPELASRAHQAEIIPVVDTALSEANVQKSELTAIAFTQGPGLLGALLVGASFAKSMALALDIPLIGVNHMKAHILAHWIDDPKPQFPFLCLTVSGGHTQLVKMENVLDFQLIGETRDDAVGEAFDKCAKILGFPYPGGPYIDKHAQKGNPRAFEFPISNLEGYDFSFSGIKTALLYFVQKMEKQEKGFIPKHMDDVCASLQYALIQMLLKKVEKACQEYQITNVGIAGGVSANSGLREALKNLGEKRRWDVFIPDFQYCTDNAGMIAMASHFQSEAKDFVKLDVSPKPRYPITE